VPSDVGAMFGDVVVEGGTIVGAAEMVPELRGGGFKEELVDGDSSEDDWNGDIRVQMLAPEVISMEVGKGAPLMFKSMVSPHMRE